MNLNIFCPRAILSFHIYDLRSTSLGEARDSLFEVDVWGAVTQNPQAGINLCDATMSERRSQGRGTR